MFYLQHRTLNCSNLNQYEINLEENMTRQKVGRQIDWQLFRYIVRQIGRQVDWQLGRQVEGSTLQTKDFESRKRINKSIYSLLTNAFVRPLLERVYVQHFLPNSASKIHTTQYRYIQFWQSIIYQIFKQKVSKN